MTTDSSSALVALRNSHDRLDALVRPLTPEQLRSQSYDKDWSIAQVLSHLGSGAEIALLPLDAAVNGVEAPGREAMARIWDAWNARSPDQQAADALVWDARYVHRLEHMTPEQGARVHVSFFGRDFGVEDLTRLRLGEHAVHVWDIAVMQDPATQVAPDAVAIILDNLPMTAQWSGKSQGRPLRVHVRTQQPDRDFLLEVGESVRLTPSSGEEASAELVLTAEAFVRLVYGRLDPEHTPAGIETRNVDLAELRQIFPGF